MATAQNPTATRGAAAILSRALAAYPAPFTVKTRGQAEPVYAPPVDLAFALYARSCQRTAEEAGVIAAFAAIVPKVLERCRATVSALLGDIADCGAIAGEHAKERVELLEDLNVLAVVLASPEGRGGVAEHAAEYYAVCEALQELSSAGRPRDAY